MESRTYSVRELRTELLFWKKELAVYSNSVSPTFSRTVALGSVMQTCCSREEDSTSMGSVVDGSDGIDSDGSGLGIRSESRRVSDTPFSYL